MATTSNPAAPVTQAPVTQARQIKPPEKREYIVFLKGAPQGDHNQIWIEVGKATTATNDDALDAVVERLDKDEQDGPFMVVAARSCVVRTPHIEPPPPPKRTWK